MVFSAITSPRREQPTTGLGQCAQRHVSLEPEICGDWVWQIDSIRVRGFAFFIPSPREGVRTVELGRYN